MRQLIQQRQGEHTPQMRPRGWSTTSIPRSPMDSRLDVLDSAVSDAEKELTRALSSYESLQQDLRQVAVAYKEVGHHSCLILETGETNLNHSEDVGVGKDKN